MIMEVALERLHASLSRARLLELWIRWRGVVRLLVQLQASSDSLHSRSYRPSSRPSGTSRTIRIVSSTRGQSPTPTAKRPRPGVAFGTSTPRAVSEDVPHRNAGTGMPNRHSRDPHSALRAIYEAERRTLLKDMATLHEVALTKESERRDLISRLDYEKELHKKKLRLVTHRLQEAEAEAGQIRAEKAGLAERLSHASAEFEKTNVELEQYKATSRYADQRARQSIKEELQRATDRARAMDSKAAELEREAEDARMQLRKVIHDSTQEKSALYAAVDEKTVAAHEAEARTAQCIERLERCKRVQKRIESNERNTSKALGDLLVRLRTMMPSLPSKSRSRPSLDSSFASPGPPLDPSSVRRLLAEFEEIVLHLKERADCAETVRMDAETRYSAVAGDSDALRNQLIEQAQAAEFDVSKALGHAEVLSQKVAMLQADSRRLGDERDAAERQNHAIAEQLRSLSETLALERRVHQEKSAAWEEERAKMMDAVEASTANDPTLRISVEDSEAMHRRADHLATTNAELQAKVRQQRQPQSQKTLGKRVLTSELAELTRELHAVRLERNELATIVKQISQEHGVDATPAQEKSEAIERLSELAKQLFDEREARVAIENQAAEERSVWTAQLEDLQSGLEAQAAALGTFTAKHQEAVVAAESAEQRAREAHAQLAMRSQVDENMEKAMENRVQLAEQRAQHLSEQLTELRARSHVADLDRLRAETVELRAKVQNTEADLHGMEARASAAEDRAAHEQVRFSLNPVLSRNEGALTNSLLSFRNIGIKSTSHLLKNEQRCGLCLYFEPAPSGIPHWCV
jgi:hypothetical protein